MHARRLLHLVGTSRVGGTERFLSSLAAGLRQAGWINGIAVLEAPGPLAEAYARAADDVRHLDVDSRGMVGALREWRALVRAFAPGVVILYGFRANLLGRVASGAVPVVSALRSVYIDERGTRVARWLDRATFHRVDACIANSQEAIRRHVAAGFPADRFVWIPNGIDVSRFREVSRERARERLHVPRDQRIVLSIANLKPVKNHGVLLDASRALHDAGVRHRLWLVGEGPLRGTLEERARALGIHAHVDFLGAVADPLDCYACADAFALTSDYEGMPTVLIEAFAAGVPVVATRVGDVPAMCAGDAGVVVPPRDASATARALEAVLTDADLARRLRARGAEVAARYSAGAMVSRYARVLEDVAEGRPPSVAIEAVAG
ncbi:MAG: glycosyltransferase [Acidobacteria bacterium]|nr:glycosyltransferase [Acidobacteriota bacterium]